MLPGARDDDLGAAPVKPGERLLELALDGAADARALALPAEEVRPVVGERDAVRGQGRARQRGVREPGFSGFEPAAQSGQASAA